MYIFSVHTQCTYLHGRHYNRSRRCLPMLTIASTNSIYVSMRSLCYCVLCYPLSAEAIHVLCVGGNYYSVGFFIGSVRMKQSV